MKSILVTGGTGNLGSKVTSLLSAQNYDVSVLSTRRPNPTGDAVKIHTGDIASNTGLSEATRDADIIIHCASNPMDFEKVDITGTRNLIHAIDKSKTKLLIYISIVGIHKSDYPYYKAKLAAEKIIMESGIPCTILRVTQFHEFVEYILQTCINRSKGVVVSIPDRMKFQSISVNEVAMKLTTLCNDEALGVLPDFAGPEIMTFEAMAQVYIETAALNYKLQQERVEDELYDVFRSGINLSPGNTSGGMTWQKFLNLKFKGG